MMRNAVDDIFTIARKELLHFFRDAHVLIYSLLLPMVGYPLLVIGCFESQLWQESLSQKKQLVIAFEPSAPDSKMPLVEHMFKETVKSKTQGADAVAALRAGAIDAIVRTDKPDLLDIVLNGTSTDNALLKSRLFQLASSSRQDTIDEKLKAANRSPDFLQIFKVKLKNLAPISELTSYVLPAITGFALLMVGVGAIYPTVCAFPEEREKHTLDSTLILPVDRFALVLGKSIATTTVSLMSGAVNFFSMLMVYGILTSQPASQKLLSKLGGGSLFGNFHAEQLLLMLVCFVTITVEIVSIYLLMVQSSRSFKEAQNILTVPVLVLIAVPILLCYPDLQLTIGNAFIPGLNLVLTMREAFAESADYKLCALAIAENVAIIALIFAIIGKIVGREDFLEGNVGVKELLSGGGNRK
jgi:sodium transport system permease protein